MLRAFWTLTQSASFFTVWLLFRLLGWSAIAGVAVLVILLPIQTRIASLYNRYQEELLAAADARLTLATEVISQVRIVKYFAWESKFLEKMNETRKKELSALWKRALTTVLAQSIMFGAPVIVGAATFTFHTKGASFYPPRGVLSRRSLLTFSEVASAVMKQDLAAETAFTALALFNVLRSPLEGFTDSKFSSHGLSVPHSFPGQSSHLDLLSSPRSVRQRAPGLRLSQAN